MANLLSTLARKERERFFWRLDSEWGKGFKRGIQSHPDRSRDPRRISGPPKLTQYRVDYREDRFSDWVNLWATEYPELAYGYCETLKAEGFKARVFSREPVALSTNQSARVTDIVAEFFAGCSNQTLVKRAWEVKKPKVYRSTRLMPQPLAEPDCSGEIGLIIAPRECTGSAIATSVSAQLELLLVMSPSLMFRSSWHWPKVSLDMPIPIPGFTGTQLRLAI